MGGLPRNGENFFPALVAWRGRENPERLCLHSWNQRVERWWKRLGSAPELRQEQGLGQAGFRARGRPATSGPSKMGAGFYRPSTCSPTSRCLGCRPSKVQQLASSTQRRGGGSAHPTSPSCSRPSRLQPGVTPGLSDEHQRVILEIMANLLN